MRNFYVFTIFILLLHLSLKSQENGDFQTIFGGGINRISGFGGPIYNYTTVNGNFTLFSGGGGGVLLNDFFIGGYGMSSRTGIDYTSNTELSMSYGGLWFGYSFHAKRAVHPAFSLQTGWGKIKTRDDYGNININLINDRIFVVNPEVDLEFNIARFFRISLGINYRFIGGLDNNSLSFTEASGPGANLMLQFGWF